MEDKATQLINDKPRTHRLYAWTDLGSTFPLRVAPGSPARGVKPMLDAAFALSFPRGDDPRRTYEVSTDFPFRIAQADAPLPRCSAMTLVSLSGFPKKAATECRMNE